MAAQFSVTELRPASVQNEESPHLSLCEEFSFCDNGNMVFHWADFHETCDAVKASMEEYPEVREEFRRKEASLTRLALIPVWVRTPQKVFQSTMFDLYEKYILDQTQNSLGVDPFGPIEISFISGTGPFRSLAITECFNITTYKDFIQVYLLKGKLPKRDYRLRLKSKILLEYGNDFEKAQLVHLEQLSTDGLLFSVDSDLYLKDLSKQSNMRFLIDTQAMIDGQNKPLADLKAHLSQFAFNLMYSSRKEDSMICDMKDFEVQSSFEFLSNQRVYLFIAFDKMTPASKKGLNSLKGFIEHTRTLIRQHYKVDSLKKKSA